MAPTAQWILVLVVYCFPHETLSLESGQVGIHPRNQTITKGSTASFTCQTNYHVDCPEDRIYWVNRPIGGSDSDNHVLSLCSDLRPGIDIQKYSVSLKSTLNDTIYSLVIKNVTPADNKEYSCYVFREDAHVSSSPALLTVTNRTICKIPLNMSSSVSQVKELVVGDEGEFGCDVDPLPDSSTFRWFMTGEGNQTISINDTDRFATSANRLIISPLLASDNQSQIRCEVSYSQECELPSPWHQMIVVPRTVRPTDQTCQDFPTGKSTAASVTSKQHYHDQTTPTYRSPQTVAAQQSDSVGVIIGAIFAFLVLVIFTIIITCYMIKSRRPVDGELAGNDGAPGTVVTPLQIIEKEVV